jgi:hypothetical protein
MLKTMLRRLRFWLFREQENSNERIQLALGRIETRQLLSREPQRLRETEFSVFSQNGEDGVLQFLAARVAIENRFFVEFGTQDYRESNTRFLALNDHWAGVIIDGGDAHLDYLYRRSFLGFNRLITPLRAFITRDNINALLDQASVPDDLGLLSVDIDGNDYWVLEAISRGRVKPRLLVAEYNSLWGPDLALSVPYEPAFERFSAHASGLYWGVSLAALTQLLGPWGYALVYCESHGTNAFFVRRDLLGALQELSAAEAFAPCELPAAGGLAELRGRILSQALVNPSTGEKRSVGAWFSA